jgi:SET domain-containing protein
MKSNVFQRKIIVKKSRLHGYGVFATHDIKKGEKIEACYIIISRGGDKVLEDYYFDLGRGKCATMTGYGSIYNHTEEPNATYTINVTKRIATFKATKSIRKGDEIYITYGERWFKDRGWKPKADRSARKKS